MPVQVSICGCCQGEGRSGVMWGSMLRHMRMRRRRRSHVRMGMAAMFAMVSMPENRQARLVMMRMGMRACRLRGVCMGMGVTSTLVRMPERPKVGNSRGHEEDKRNPPTQECLLPAAPPYTHRFNPSGDR
jgi:hypothetical protein